MYICVFTIHRTLHWSLFIDEQSREQLDGLTTAQREDQEERYVVLAKIKLRKKHVS